MDGPDRQRRRGAGLRLEMKEDLEEVLGPNDTKYWIDRYLVCVLMAFIWACRMMRIRGTQIEMIEYFSGSGWYCFLDIFPS